MEERRVAQSGSAITSQVIARMINEKNEKKIIIIN